MRSPTKASAERLADDAAADASPIDPRQRPDRARTERALFEIRGGRLRRSRLEARQLHEVAVAAGGERRLFVLRERVRDRRHDRHVSPCRLLAEAFREAESVVDAAE